MAVGSRDLFPPSPREVYKKAPLVHVACELRFPPILRIEGQPPADFQDRIRERFPLFEKGTALPLSQFPQVQQLPSEIMQIMGGHFGSSNYIFLTEDRSSTITLTPQSLSLSTGSYHHWGQFLSDLQVPLKALVEIYNPAFFTRIGLRYIDAIHRESLGLSDRPWSQLLRQELLGELSLPIFEEQVQTAARSIQVRIPDNTGSVLLRHGFASVQGKAGLSYMIDFDFFTNQKTEVQNAEPHLAGFNKLAGRAFRWCIADDLRNALEPAEIESAAAECR